MYRFHKRIQVFKTSLQGKKSVKAMNISSEIDFSATRSMLEMCQLVKLLREVLVPTLSERVTVDIPSSSQCSDIIPFIHIYR